MRFNPLPLFIVLPIGYLLGGGTGVAVGLLVIGVVSLVAMAGRP